MLSWLDPETDGVSGACHSICGRYAAGSKTGRLSRCCAPFAKSITWSCTVAATLPVSEATAKHLSAASAERGVSKRAQR